MDLHRVAVALLLSVSSLVGVSELPAGGTHGWTTSGWHDVGAHAVLEARSAALPAQCAADPEAWIRFPVVIQSAQTISLDGHAVVSFGDPTFASVRSFYGAPTVRCGDLPPGRELVWRVHSFARYFARIDFWPRLATRRPLQNFFAETLTAAGVGALLLLGVFSLIVLRGRGSGRLAFAVASSSFLFAGYFAATVAGLFRLPFDMLAAHRFADVCALGGFLAFQWALWIQGFTRAGPFAAFAIAVLASDVIILLASSGDVVQLGTTIGISGTLLVLVYSSIRSTVRLFRDERSVTSLLRFVALAFFAASACREIFFVLGLSEGPPLLPIGVVAGQLFFVLSINAEIEATYRERDYLRRNLQAEVERQTEEIRQRTADLEAAMKELRSLQAGLVQAEKMASLGQVVAGVAHELNNPASFVHGALENLGDYAAAFTRAIRAYQALPANASPSELEERIAEIAKRERLDYLIRETPELLRICIEGSQRIKTIVGDLRVSARADGGERRWVDVREGLDSTLNLLSHRIRALGIEVERRYGEMPNIVADASQLNQVWMNLLANAVDAVEGRDHPRIVVSVGPSGGDAIEVSVRDNGVGVSEELRSRIFDPFFTTKPIGKGTGLGLSIAYGAIKSHGGEIAAESTVGQGTEMHVRLPIGA